MIGTVRSDGTVGPYELDIPREFWRYLFAGLTMPWTVDERTWTDSAREGVRAADALLTELEGKGGLS